MAKDATDGEALARRVVDGDRRALARAITLVESTRPTDHAAAEALIDAVLPNAGGALRIGISGAPGAGKSAFIEAIGLHWLAHGHRLAVLAVDPSSPRSGGAILGDKTRMERLAREPGAYIRPTPSSGTLGGVALATGEAIALAEAAGHDIVVVETVGVGQSEVAVADLTDLFVLLVAPGGGDELQGVKRGIVELADMVVVTKCDGDLAPAAGRIAADYQAALGLMRPAKPGWTPCVEHCSALTSQGIDRVADAIARFDQATRKGRVAHRAAQAKRCLGAAFHDAIERVIAADAVLAEHAEALESEVLVGRLGVRAAARALIEAALGRSRSS